jgi:hypothetical protein
VSASSVRKITLSALLVLGALLVASVPSPSVAQAPEPEIVIGAVAPSPLPAPLTAPLEPPAITRVWLNERVLQRGDVWAGEITTTTNTASLEARVAIFSLSLQRTAFGQFTFAIRVPAVPWLYRGKRTLRLIARNAAGDAAVEELPIRFR